MIQASHKQSGKFCVACIDSRDLLTAAQRMLPFRRWTVLAAAVRCRESVEFMPGCGCGCAGNLQAACNLWVYGNVLRWRYGMTQLVAWVVPKRRPAVHHVDAPFVNRPGSCSDASCVKLHMNPHAQRRMAQLNCSASGGGQKTAKRHEWRVSFVVANSRGLQLAQELLDISLNGGQLALSAQTQAISGAQRDECLGVESCGIGIGVADHLQLLNLASANVTCMHAMHKS